MTPAEIAKCKELLSNMTPGPWDADNEPCDRCYYVMADGEDLFPIDGQDDAYGITYLRNHADKLLAAAEQSAAIDRLIDKAAALIGSEYRNVGVLDAALDWAAGRAERCGELERAQSDAAAWRACAEWMFRLSKSENRSISLQSRGSNAAEND